MKLTLVGNTGFVGRNLTAAAPFDAQYSGDDVHESFGADNGLVVYCGMPCIEEAGVGAEADFAARQFDNITKMRPERLALISSTAVYPRPSGVYEDTPIAAEHSVQTGHLALEGWVREAFPEALIVRLPALFGEGMRENFIYDMLMPVPRALCEAHYNALSLKSPEVAVSYQPGPKGAYALSAQGEKLGALKHFFEQNDFNARNFTDSRSILQFYDLANLWHDIERCLSLGLGLVNFATEPVEAGALYHFLFGEEFENHLAGPPPIWDVRTHFGREFGGHDDYIADRTEVVAGIAKFVGRVMANGGLI